MNRQKGFVNIVLIFLAVVLVGVLSYFVFTKKSPSNTEDANVYTSGQETTNWQDHSNESVGFIFKYPQTWKVEDGLKTNTCCLNLFSSISPYDGDLLKQTVMKAQFQYHADASVSNKQEYVDKLIRESEELEMSSPIDRSSIVSIPNENGTNILKFEGGVGSIGYIIPRKADFSEVLYVIVWNPDSMLEKVLSTINIQDISARPSIVSLSPSAVPMLTGLVINGSNFDPLGAYSGNGWLTHSHVMVKITDKNGQTGILWEGGSYGGNVSTNNQIIVPAIPKSICKISEVGAGGCPDGSRMEIELGQYFLTVTVDGRGTSNPVALNVIQGMQ